MQPTNPTLNTIQSNVDLIISSPFASYKADEKGLLSVVGFFSHVFSYVNFGNDTESETRVRNAVLETLKRIESLSGGEDRIYARKKSFSLSIISSDLLYPGYYIAESIKQNPQFNQLPEIAETCRKILALKENYPDVLGGPESERNIKDLKIRLS